MKHIKLIFIAVAAFVLMAPACSKDDSDILPPATQTGANTFGCKINGVVYKCSGHKNADMWLTSEGCSFYLHEDAGQKKVALTAWTKNPDAKPSIDFTYIEKKTGIYKEGLRYHTSSLVEGFDSYVNVTRFDDDIISGTFQMKVKFQYKIYEPDGIKYRIEESIQIITDGRFDLTINKK